MSILKAWFTKPPAHVEEKKETKEVPEVQAQKTRDQELDAMVEAFEEQRRVTVRRLTTAGPHICEALRKRRSA